MKKQQNLDVGKEKYISGMNKWNCGWSEGGQEEDRRRSFTMDATKECLMG